MKETWGRRLPWPPARGAGTRQLLVLHMTFLSKLSETLKEVYCNVNNLSLVASVFLIPVEAGVCWPGRGPHTQGWAPSCPLADPARGELGQVLNQPVGGPDWGFCFLDVGLGTDVPGTCGCECQALTVGTWHQAS